MPVQPYLFFAGQCEEAIAFYKGALGAEVEMVMRWSDAPEPPPPGMLADNWNDKVMHSAIRVADTVVMASDGMGPKEATFSGVELAVTLPSEADVATAFNALADGGTIQMPLGKTFFARSFGSVKDRFGVSWMVTTPD
jgi:PhnB protein